MNATYIILYSVYKALGTLGAFSRPITGNEKGFDFNGINNGYAEILKII